nr:putative serine/threonine/dual specificity protein kinase, catalytic domain-containing protein [Tanacetum cinerariifolium]
MEDTRKPSFQTQVCHQFSLSDIRTATNDFDEELVIGRGGFGNVYKGNIKVGANDVITAIKRLRSNSSQGASEFWAEVEMLSKLRHCNLASLIGYCNDEKEMIIVYEYMPQGTLEGCLHKAGTSLSWLQRLNICIGAARGLDYLHTGTGTKQGVIHRDVKSSNILLDENYAAKISDFGLAKVGPTNQTDTFVNTGVKGTFGYMDPMYFYTNKLTRKSDVYAFGVVLFEVLCGRPAVDTSLDEEQWGLATWAQDCIREGKLSQVIDSNLRRQISTDCLKEFAQVAASCLHSLRNQRPTMAEVITKLDFALSLQKKMGQSATNIKVSKKLWSFFTAKGWRLNNLMSLCFARSEPVGVNVNKVVSTRVGSVGSIVDVGYESGGDLVHFGGGFDFTLTELLTASTKFLNENPYWRTYVAYLADGSQVIVKRILTQLSQKKFVNVVSALGKIHHPNVLDLKAYYWGSGETLCAFKFTPNGSVSSLLQSSENQSGSIPTFDWTMRINIITGITKGLFYLHTQEKIAHGDLKSSMILLDENYSPMIANVGLSQLMSTAPRRFRNNCAPEFIGSRNVTSEVDVYSLGIIMLELLTGQSTYKGIHPVDLPTWVKSVPKEKWSAEAFDAKLMQEKSEDHNMMVNVMRLSLQCVEDDPKARPTVRDVLRELEQIEDFRRWQKKIHFFLTTLKVVYVLSTQSPEWSENENLEMTRKRMKWENDDYICRGHILN